MGRRMDGWMDGRMKREIEGCWGKMDSKNNKMKRKTVQLFSNCNKFMSSSFPLHNLFFLTMED